MVWFALVCLVWVYCCAVWGMLIVFYCLACWIGGLLCIGADVGVLRVVRFGGFCSVVLWFVFS